MSYPGLKVNRKPCLIYCRRVILWEDSRWDDEPSKQPCIVIDKTWHLKTAFQPNTYEHHHKSQN